MKYFFSLLFVFSFIVFPSSSQTAESIHVLVALCDNENQEKLFVTGW